MLRFCLNCEHTYEGPFCPHCGQSAKVKRIAASALLEDVLHFFTHLEKGFLFTSWHFLIAPGISSIQYISGKLKTYHTAVSYFLIWTGLYIILHNSIVHYFDYLLSGEVITQLDTSGQNNK